MSQRKSIKVTNEFLIISAIKILAISNIPQTLVAPPVRRRLRSPVSKKGMSLQFNEPSDCTIQPRRGKMRNTPTNRSELIKNCSKRRNRHDSIKCKSESGHQEGDIRRQPSSGHEQDGETQQQCQ
ncbi:hypothetical protein ALC57_07788 [Trachymyrmex cornetzi]|uniref:Uncharacterized protein n=1 Tax=Trachymyrmex cornetzi TaxID=471704 RepID=A0A151J7I8_9HYME|nr:hypothetical protein ALC57_07788 [Trachymyrmex cornetzi]